MDSNKIVLRGGIWKETRETCQDIFQNFIRIQKMFDTST